MDLCWYALGTPGGRCSRSNNVRHCHPGARGEIVEGDVLIRGVVGDTLIKGTKGIHPSRPCLHLPITILNGHLIEITVDLDAEHLENCSANQQGRVAIDNEGLKCTLLVLLFRLEV